MDSRSVIQSSGMDVSCDGVIPLGWAPLVMDGRSQEDKLTTVVTLPYERALADSVRYFGRQPASTGAHRSETQFKTTMPAPYLAPEIIDNIIDNLSDERATLFDCSIVSKSWIPHARKHLFATIRFTSSADVQRWRLLFRNSQVPPGQFIKTLHLTSRSRENYGSGMADFVVIIQPLTEANTDLMDLIAALTMADTETGVAIQAFSKVLSLEVDTTYDPCKLAISFVSLHGFSAALTSFTIVTSHPTLEIFLNFALSFPRLENLTLCQNRHFEGHALVRRPDIHPPLTGILKLSSGVRGIIKAVIGPLLEQGVEFQFQKVSVCCKVKEQEVEALEAVIERCSNTLQYLKVQFFGAFVCPSLLS